jgi:hypothetical protein
MPHFTISAKTGFGVIELFHDIINLITERLSNIKIIEQIDERDEKEDKSVEAQSAKPVI